MKRLKKQRGQSLVEFAIILPLILLILLAIFEIGPLMNTFMKIEKAAQYGARTASIHGTENSSVLRAVLYNMQGMTGGEGDFTTKSNGTETISVETHNGMERTIVEITPGNVENRINGSWAMVRVTYRYKIITPLVASLFHFGGDSMYDDNHYEITRYAIYRVE